MNKEKLRKVVDKGLNRNIRYFIGYISTNDTQLLKVIRDAVKGSGVTIWRRGRATDRSAATNRFGRWHSQSVVNIPFAEYFALYLRDRDGYVSYEETNRRLNRIRRKIAEALVGYKVKHAVIKKVDPDCLATVVTNLSSLFQS